jgi:phosphate transport system protein
MRDANDAQLEAQIQRLRHQVVFMGRTVEEMLVSGLRAVSDGDIDCARQTIQRDDVVDRLEKESGSCGLQILAHWRPQAANLRFVVTALQVVTEIERIADMAVNVCRKLLELREGPPASLLFDVQRLGRTALTMIHQVLDALEAGDAETALAVIEEDDVLDRNYRQFSQEILACMIADRRCIPAASCIQVIAKDMERIGDHASTVAELVVFMVNGEDIRHTRTNRSGFAQS